jgi:hypothetical protein
LYKGTVEEWLVQWEGQPTEEATWELETAVLEHFPTFDLEDKIPFDTGSNVTIENETGQEARGNGPTTSGLSSNKRGKQKINEGEHSKIRESSREKKLPTWMENYHTY